MALQVGSRLGHYEVTALIGEGGMGQVYQATDTKLNRQVALKILPEAFAADPDRLARFQREAQVLASLNHPNIAAIHGLEDSAGTKALVLELVEGPTLADRIAQGPIPIDKALPIAKQIAEALEAAHEAGVIHRDLKPANIKVREDGTVKVLDFGLAKALEGNTGSDPSESPTLTAAATQMGVIMGTAAYMAPEQAKGKIVDKRADIWAFGAVLYEMLTGQKPFVGEDVSDTLATVLKTDPEWKALPGDTPPRVRQLLQTCLQKNPKQRVQAIGDVRLAMEGAFESLEVAAAPVTRRTVGGRLAVAWVASTLIASAVTGVAIWNFARGAALPSAGVARMSLVLPEAQRMIGSDFGQLAISPGGTHVVYVANRQLYLRALDNLETQPLAGTELTDPASPFFSHDGQWIGFYSARERVLKRVALAGGATVRLSEAGNSNGASWSTDDTLVLVDSGTRILRVVVSGGPPEVLVEVDPPNLVRRPQLLPGGEAVLYTLRRQ